jgi:DNA-binding IclR family transcriptional regulator
VSSENRSEFTSTGAGFPTGYHVPALEKGLDILELLASQRLPMTQAQLARALGRGASELFRMLACLEQRGYLARDPTSGAYSLTLRLYEISRAHSPFEGLLRAAAAPMRQLTEQLRESCHLSVLHRGQLLVLAQQESPAQLRLSVEVGGSFAPLQTASGRLLLAFLPPRDRDELLAAMPVQQHAGMERQAALATQLEQIRARGYEASYGETIAGINDLAVLVGSADSAVQAALAIPSIGQPRETFVDTILPAARDCAQAIARAAGIIVGG